MTTKCVVEYIRDINFIQAIHELGLGPNVAIHKLHAYIFSPAFVPPIIRVLQFLHDNDGVSLESDIPTFFIPDGFFDVLLDVLYACDIIDFDIDKDIPYLFLVRLVPKRLPQIVEILENPSMAKFEYDDMSARLETIKAIYE